MLPCANRRGEAPAGAAEPAPRHCGRGRNRAESGLANQEACLAMEALNTYKAGPDERGHFGIFGGRFVAETLMPLILAVERAYAAGRNDAAFQAEIDDFAKHYVGRPSPLYFAERQTGHFGTGNKGAKIYFKRDELNHTGSHKINNCVGQILLARRMGKTRIIAETGSGTA